MYEENNNNDNSVPETSCLKFISSLHGEIRRRERDIDKRDLKEAIKYGVKTPTYARRRNPNAERELRYKYQHMNITYITDVTSTREITSYADELPIHTCQIEEVELRKCEEERRRAKSVGLTSHTILIVDQSGSMNNSDVNGHRSRTRAVYHSLGIWVK
eukprot:Pgem_evm1s9902